MAKAMHELTHQTSCLWPETLAAGRKGSCLAPVDDMALDGRLDIRTWGRGDREIHRAEDRKDDERRECEGRTALKYMNQMLASSNSGRLSLSLVNGCQ